MNCFWHLLGTDFRRHRWVLLLWLVIATASAATVGLMPTAAATPRAASQAGLLYFLLSCTYVALFVCLVPLVVQGDAAVGSDVFWMTRPIPPRSLFAEKLALLFAALALLPVAADGVLMAAYGVPLGDAAGVAAQGVFFKLLWIVVLMILAVLTASLPRFALLAAVVMALAVGMVAASVAMTVSQFNDDPPLSQTGTIFSETAFMLAVGSLLAAGLLLSMVQYATRRRARSIVVGGVCAIFGFAAAASVPTPTADQIGDAPGWARDSSRVHLSANPDEARISTQFPTRSARGWKLVSAPVYVAGLESAWSAEIKIRESTWRTNARTAWASPAPITSQLARIEKDETSITTATRQLLGVSRVVQVQPSWDRPPSATLAVIDDRKFPSLPGEPGTYAAKATVSLIRHSIEGALPLKEGVEFRHGARRVSISRVYRDAGGVTILLRVSYANSMFNGEPSGERSYFVRSPVASEAIPASLEPADVSGLSFLPWMTFMGGGGSSYSYEGSGFNVQSWLLKVGSISGPNGPIWRLTDGWLSHAEFVVVTSRREGSVDRDLLVDNFPLRTAPEATTQ